MWQILRVIYLSVKPGNASMDNDSVPTEVWLDFFRYEKIRLSREIAELERNLKSSLNDLWECEQREREYREQIKEDLNG